MRPVIALLMITACTPRAPYVHETDASLPDAGPAPALVCVDGYGECPDGWATGCASRSDSHVARNGDGVCSAVGFTAPPLCCDPATGAFFNAPGCDCNRGEPACVPLFDGCPDPAG